MANIKFLIRKRLAAAKQAAPDLFLNSYVVPENSVQGTVFSTAVPTNANNPGDISITTQEVANLFAVDTDGRSLIVGSAYATLNYETKKSATITLEYTDDDGTYQFDYTIGILDVADGPTTDQAITDLETMIGTAQVGVEVTGDLNDLFVSPTAQTMTYVVSHGSVDVDGYTWTWTPSTSGSTTVQVTATDEDSQSLQIEYVVDVVAGNSAPVTVDVVGIYLVPPPSSAVAPSNSVVPALSGTETVGSTLTSTTGTWSGDATITYGYQWERSANGSTGWANIGGATTSMYTLTASDDTQYVRCTVTATNNAGNASASSSASSQILYPVPSNSAVPTISGTEQVGFSLSSTTGTWTNSPSSYSYQWQTSANGTSGWSNISGATSSSYLLTATEANQYVRCAVTATNSGGSSSAANSAASGQIADVPGAGAVSGYDTPQTVINSTTNTNSYSGTVTGVESGERVYAIIGVLSENSSAGGIPSNWTVTLGGNAMSLTASVTSANVDSAAGIFELNAPSTGDLTLSVGTSGGVRACTAIVWRIAGQDTGTPTVAYSALRNGSQVTSFSCPNSTSTVEAGDVVISAIFIDGGDINSLAVTGADGSTVSKSGTNGFSDLTWGYAYKLQSSVANVTFAWSWTTADNVSGGFFIIKPGAATPVNTVAPAISGTEEVGEDLTSTTGTWSGSPTGYTYQWERSANGTTGWGDISGATSATYTLVSADDTQYVRCTVTATNTSGSTDASSAASGQIVYPVPTNSSVPTISGTEQVGETLTSTTGSWTNTPTSYTYQWQVSADGSTGWSNISGATSSTYDLTASEEDQYVRSTVVANNSGGSSTAANSASSGQIAAAAGGGITGHDAPQSVINSTSTTSSFSGTVTGVASGERVYIAIGALSGNTAADDTSTWAVTLDGNTVSATDTTNSSGTVNAVTWCGEIDAPSTGDLTLAVNCGANVRALQATAWRIAGQHATPTTSANATQSNSGSTSRVAPGSLTTGYDDSVILSYVCVKGGSNITGLAVATADGSSTGDTGSDSVNDIAFGYAHDLVATAGSETLTWSWTGSASSAAVYFEVRPA